MQRGFKEACLGVWGGGGIHAAAMHLGFGGERRGKPGLCSRARVSVHIEREERGEQHLGGGQACRFHPGSPAPPPT